MISTKNTKAAVIGCGRMGTVHAINLVKLGVCIDIVYDINISAAIQLAASLKNCRATDDVDQIKWSNLDLVVICTPPNDRFNFFVKAMNAELAVFLEKPLCVNAQPWFEYVKSEDVSRKIVAVGYMNRYRPSVLRAKKVLSNMPAFAANANWIGGKYNVPWWTNDSISGGPLNEQGGHIVDLLRFLMGEVKSVSCSINSDGGEYKTSASILCFSAGDLATVLHSCSAQDKNISFSLHGISDTIVLSDWQLNLTWAGGEVLGCGPNPNDRNWIFFEEMKCFVDSFVTNDPSKLKSDLHSALRTQLVLDALRQSAKTGSEVLL